MSRMLTALCLASLCAACSDPGATPLSPAQDDAAVRAVSPITVSATTSSYQMTTLDFEDLYQYGPSGSIPEGYHGMSFTNLGYATSGTPPATSTYLSYTNNDERAAQFEFSPEAYPDGVYLSSFKIASADAGSDWITLWCYDGADEDIGSVDVTLNSDYSTVDVNLAGVRRCKLEGIKATWQLDDLTFSGPSQVNDPATKDDCKNGGWDQFGFKNQGQCVRFVETGKDSR